MAARAIAGHLPVIDDSHPHPPPPESLPHMRYILHQHIKP
jgi:hypothetical protein